LRFSTRARQIGGDRHKTGILAMLQALTVLFSCQLAGEVAVRLTGLTFPGPVLGMALLFGLLLWRGRTEPALDAVTDTILRNLSLLFVPAFVGVIQQIDLIAANWVAIGTALLISTLFTLLVTVFTFRAVARLIEGRRA
jgi:holin-like protein